MDLTTKPLPPGTPLPAAVIAAKSEPKEKNPGWWDLHDIAGSVDGVTRAVREQDGIPEHWKTSIIADIREKCGAEFNFVYLDCGYVVHLQRKDGATPNAVLHYHIQPDKKLL